MNLQANKNRFLPVTGFFMILILSIAYSFLLPICQVPDEETHLKNICEAVGIEGVYEQYVEIGRPFIVSVIMNHEKVDKTAYRALYSYRLDYSLVHFDGISGLSVFKYLPQIILFIPALLAHLPFMLCLHLTEISAAVISSVVCYYALKMMPVKKEAFLAVMLLPVCLQQYGSFNYDATLLPFSFLALALMLSIEYDGYTLKKCIFLFLSFLLVGITKPPYIAIFLLLFMLLFKSVRKDGKTDYALVRSRIFLLLFIGLQVVIAGVFAVYLLRNVSRISILAAALRNPFHYINLYHFTWKMQWWSLVSQIVGNLGWLNTPMPDWYIWFTLAGLLLLSMMGDGIKIPPAVRVFSFTALYVTIHLIFISMISHTFMLGGLAYDCFDDSRESLTMIGIILGVQGRYFVPVLMNLLLTIGGDYIRNRKVRLYVQILYYAVMLTVPVWAIVCRYWI